MSARSHVLAVSSTSCILPPLVPSQSTLRIHYASIHWVTLVSCHCGTTFWPQPVNTLIVVLHLLANASCCREVGALWTDLAVTLVAVIGDPAAEVAGLVARAPSVALGHCGGQLCQLSPARVVESSECRRSQLSEVSISLWIRLCNHAW